MVTLIGDSYTGHLYHSILTYQKKRRQKFVVWQICLHLRGGGAIYYINLLELGIKGYTKYPKVGHE